MMGGAFLRHLPQEGSSGQCGALAAAPTGGVVPLANLTPLRPARPRRWTAWRHRAPRRLAGRAPLRRRTAPRRRRRRSPHRQSRRGGPQSWSCSRWRRATARCSAGSSSGTDCSRTTANSSPPCRTARSSGRTYWPMMRPTCRSTSSPTPWPCTSLTFLKSSRSMSSNAAVASRRTGRVSHAWKTRRFCRPVSTSVEASRARRRWSAAAAPGR